MRLDESMPRLHARLSRMWPLLFAAVVFVDLIDLASASRLGYGWHTAHGLGPLALISAILIVGLLLAAHVWLTLTVGLKLIRLNRTRFLLLALGLVVLWVSPR